MTDHSARMALAQRLLSQGRAAQAEAELRRALQSAPGSPDLNIGMALVLNTMGQGERALYFAQRAVQARPADPILLVNQGMILGSLGRSADALPIFERAAALAPSMPHARQGLASVLRTLARHTEAVEHARLGLASAPADPDLAALYAAGLTNCARVREAAAFAAHFLRSTPNLTMAMVYANAMTYNDAASPEEVLAAHAVYGRALQSTVRPLPPASPSPDPDRPLRVGILSAELRRHAVATFLEPWLAHHDAAAVNLLCYHTVPTEDHVSARLKPMVQGWRNVAALDDAAMAARLRADRIDILVETTGITHAHRLGVMAMRPAPIQVSCLGYLNTTGLSAIDYRIVDAHTDPAGAESLSVEALERLDPTCWCYRPPDAAPDPRMPQGPITFGSFNSAAKINDSVIALWSRILNDCPGSRLLLKAFDFADPLLVRDLAARFEREGIERGRLDIEGPTLDLGSFLDNYSRIHIALDPFPFNGTTTTLDALWMGVPVVSLAGRMHAGRTGVSILHTLGSPELLADTPDRYHAIVVALAADLPGITRYRSTLRPRLAASSLCDGPAHARRMDASLRSMWRRWCARPRP